MSTISDDIQKELLGKLQTDSEAKTILKKIRNGEGDYSDAEKYADRAGQLLTEVLQAHITTDNFPVGSVDEIAGLIVPALELNHKAVTQVAGEVQKTLNGNGGIGMNTVTPKFDRHAAYNLVGRTAGYETFEDAAFMFVAPIREATKAYADATLKSNVDFQYKSGMKPKIIRTCESDACEWCKELAGEYDYEEVKDKFNPVWQRHNNCFCEITYEPGDGRTKHVSLASDDEEKQNRKAFAESEDKEYKKNSTLGRDKNRQQARSGDNVGSSIKTPGQREIEVAIKEQINHPNDSSIMGDMITNNHKDLKYFSPESMLKMLKEASFTVTPLEKSGTGFNDRPFEEGGGYITHFCNNAVFQYHPTGGRHEIAYWKINYAKGGKHHYDTNGREFIIEKNGKITYID